MIIDRQKLIYSTSSTSTIGLFITSCSSTRTTSESKSVYRDGSTYETAVIAKSIQFEYQWIAQNYPGSKVVMQSLHNHKNKPFDVLTIETEGGIQKDIYFDISRFFGKY